MAPNTLLLAALLTCACRDADRPSTTYFAAQRQNGTIAPDEKLRTHAHAQAFYDELYDPSAPNEYSVVRRFRQPWLSGPWWPHVPDADKKELFKIGDLDVRIVSENSSNERVCGLHIGPNFVRGPFPIELIYDLFDDQDLANRVRATVGKVDIARTYEIETTVGGFRIRLAQRSQPSSIEIVIDGCGRVAPRFQGKYPSRDLMTVYGPDEPDHH